MSYRLLVNYKQIRCLAIWRLLLLQVLWLALVSIQAANCRTPKENEPKGALQQDTWIRAGRKPDFFVFTHSGQVLETTLASSCNASIRARTGTALMLEPRALVLNEGAIVFYAKNGAGTISTRQAVLAVPPLAQLFLECVPGQNLLRVVNASHDKTQVSVRERKGGKSTALAQGEELLLVNNETASRRSCDLKSLKSECADLFPKGAALKPDPPIRVFARKNSIFRVSTVDAITVYSGEIFVWTPYSIKLCTDSAELGVPRDAFASLANDESALRIKAFNEPLACSVLRAKKTIGLAQGREFSLANQAASSATAVSADGVGRRRHQTLALLNDLKIDESDFSLRSFLSQSGFLASLKEPRSKDDRQLSQKYLKTTVAVEAVTNHYGSYSAR